MKIRKSIAAVIATACLIAAINHAAGQSQNILKPELIPHIGTNRFSSVIVHVDYLRPQLCPLELTNHISNTNLFTFQEQMKIAQVKTKYQNVSTNSLPQAAILKDWPLRSFKVNGVLTTQGKWDPSVKTITFPVARFGYTNSEATEEMMSSSEDQIVVRFRAKSNDGYDAVFIHNQLFRYIEYKDGFMDGLCVVFINDFRGKKRMVKSDDFVFLWARFSKGKMVGKFLEWDTSGRLSSHVEFAEPFDFLKHSKDKFDLSWEPAATL